VQVGFFVMAGVLYARFLELLADLVVGVVAVATRNSVAMLIIAAARSTNRVMLISIAQAAV
jgi:hypothetical protein